MEQKKAESYQLTIPARAESALVARMALSAVGALCGLDIDLIGDLRTVTTECCDCLIHQGCALEGIQMEAARDTTCLTVRFRAVRCAGENAVGRSDMNLDVTRGILETLIPEVCVLSDERGVYGFDLKQRL